MMTADEALGNGVSVLAAQARHVTVLHAHYYDAALHRGITETGSVDGRATLERAAASAAYRAAASWGMERSGSRRPLLAGLLEEAGVGRVVRCGGTGVGAEVALSPSLFAAARVRMFGRSARPACDVTRGIIAGTLGALYSRAYAVSEVECVAAGGSECRFLATPGARRDEVGPPPALEWPIPSDRPPPDPASPAADVLGAVSVTPGGGPVGATYGRVWAELYARAAHEFEREVPRVMGAKFSNLASIVLTEAAHLGNFYSIGGLLRSAEWQERVAPRLASREDWAHAVVALLDTFGGGSWRVRLLAPEQRFTVHLFDGYEATAHLAAYGTAAAPRCYFARGLVAALMNLLYAGDAIAPRTLDQSLYNLLFRSPLSFRAIETRCQAMGHPYCELVANPLSPGLRLVRDLARAG
jgi:predicted hydrocarbon binding protein